MLSLVKCEDGQEKRTVDLVSHSEQEREFHFNRVGQPFIMVDRRRLQLVNDYHDHWPVVMIASPNLDGYSQKRIQSSQERWPDCSLLESR